MTWEMLIDKSQNLQDVPHDFSELAQPTAARFIRITNVFTPGGGNFAMRDLRVFGNSEQATFTPVDNITIERDADGRNAIIRWLPVANADGYLVRYGIAPDKLYNNYMVYDEDSIAIHSLNKGVEYSFSVEAFDSGTESYRPTGEFRSFQSGNWDDVNTWAQYDGTTWIHPAPHVPTPIDGAIAILAGHDITVTTADSADQLMIAAGGTLVINPGAALLVKDGIGTDMMVEGSVRNFGSLSGTTTATLTFVNGGKYIHEQDGGSIPKAAWKTGSTCELNSIKETIPANVNQNFYNIVWDCPNHTGNLSTKWNGNTIGGSIVIQNTGTGRWQMCAPTTGTAATVAINGDIIQSGGQFTSNGTSNAGTTITINHAGNIDITGGNFSISRGSQGGTGTTLWNLLNGNVSLINASTQNSNHGGAKFLFSKVGGTQTLTFSGVTFDNGGFPVEVDSGATLNMDTSILRGSGNFTLKAGATLETAHLAGLDSSLANTGTKSFDKAANFIFSGAAAQVTGSLLPDTVGGLTINNKAGVTLSKSVVVNGIMEMKSGALNLADAILSYGAVGALKYSSATAQTTNDAEFPAVHGPKDLIVANSKGLTLHAPCSISGDLFLAGKLKLETRTLTANSTVNATSSAYVVTSSGGVLKLTSMTPEQLLFPVGTTSYAPVWITNTGDPDTISVSAITDATAAEYGGRVKIRWNIGESIVGGGEYKIQFGWMAALEETAFRTNRENNARIFNLTDTTEAGSGDYITQFTNQPYTITRDGITTLGPFAVGRFRDVTGVFESTENGLMKFCLSQNYPNPFNPATTITYSVTREAFVNLRVFNLLGDEVATLVDNRVLAGAHHVVWNAQNLSAGVYFYKISVDGQTQIYKMTLLK